MKTLLHYLIWISIMLAAFVYGGIRIANTKFRDYLKTQNESLELIQSTAENYYGGITIRKSQLDSMESGATYELHGPLLKRRYWLVIEPDTTTN